MPGTQKNETGSGLLWLTAAKFYFMLTGMALLIALPAFFKKFYPDQHLELYGDFRTVMGLINWVNMVLIGGTIQAVSKFVSEVPGRTDAVKFTTLKLQAVLAGAILLVFVFGADFLATHFYRDPTLAFYLRLAAPIVPIYAFYAVLIGCLNGLGRFKHQALMDMTFATLKVGLTVGLVALGFAISGAIGAFLLTAAILLVISWLLLGREGQGGSADWRAILAFQGQTLLFAFILNGLMQVDLQVLKAFAPAALGDSSAQAGIYAAALQIGQLPYVATISVAFVIFPMVSKSTFNQDAALTRSYIATTLRYSLLLLAAMASVLASNAGGLLSLVYPSEYGTGALILAVLAGAYAFFAGAVILSSIFTASGRPLLSIAIFSLGLGAAILGCRLLVPLHGGLGAALGSLGGMALAFLVATAASLKLFGVFCPLRSLLRLLLGLAAVAAIHFVWPEGGRLLLVPRALVQMLAFGAVLYVAGERVPELAAILARRRAKRQG